MYAATVDIYYWGEDEAIKLTTKRITHVPREGESITFTEKVDGVNNWTVEHVEYQLGHSRSNGGTYSGVTLYVRKPGEEAHVYGT